MVARSKPEDLKKHYSVVGDCWIWSSSCYDTGYGKVQYQGKTWQAHRLFYFLFNGPLSEGKIVRHTCDVRNCVNPAHLILGTHQDNSNDCVERGRQSTGEGHGRALVTLEEVRQIRDLLACGLFSQARIGKFYGVKRSLISDIHNGRCWYNHG